MLRQRLLCNAHMIAVFLPEGFKDIEMNGPESKEHVCLSTYELTFLTIRNKHGYGWAFNSRKNECRTLQSYKNSYDSYTCMRSKRFLWRNQKAGQIDICVATVVRVT